MNLIQKSDSSALKMRTQLVAWALLPASADTTGGTPTYTLFGNQYTNADGTFKPTEKLNVARRLFTTTVQVRNYLVCQTSCS